MVEKTGEGERGSTAVWEPAKAAPFPLKEQKSAEVVEKKGAVFLRVQKSERMVQGSGRSDQESARREEASRFRNGNCWYTPPVFA